MLPDHADSQLLLATMSNCREFVVGAKIVAMHWRIVNLEIIAGALVAGGTVARV